MEKYESFEMEKMPLPISPHRTHTLNQKEICKYLRVKLSKRQAEDKGIDKFLPQRYTNRGKLSIKYLEKDKIHTRISGANPQEPDQDFRPPGKRARVVECNAQISNTPVKDNVYNELFSNQVLPNYFPSFFKLELLK